MSPDDIKSKIDVSKKEKGNSIFKDSIIENIKSASSNLKDEEDKEKEPEIKSNLSSVEKIRYQNIGKSFAIGGKDIIGSIYLKIKLQEIKKAKERLESITNSFSLKDEKKKEYKEKKKKSKGKTMTKFALFGLAIGATVLILKKTYDCIKDFSKKADIKKETNSYVPASLSYHAKGSKQIDGENTSYVITSSSGIEIPISDSSGKNDVEEAAKTTDELIIKNVLGRIGLDGFLNPDDVNKSLIGYIIFKPLETFVKLTTKYFADSIRNPKLGRLQEDFYWQIEWLTDMISDKIENMTYKGRYSSVTLHSQDEYLQSVAKLKNSLNKNLVAGSTSLGGKIERVSGYTGLRIVMPEHENYEGDKRQIYFYLPDAKTVYENIEYIIENSSHEDIIKMASNLKDGRLKIGESGFEKANTTEIKTNMHIHGSSGDKDIAKFINWVQNAKHGYYKNYTEAGGKISIGFTNQNSGKIYVGNWKSDKAKEEYWYKEYYSVVKNNYKKIDGVANYFGKDITRMMVEIKTRKMFLDEFLKTRDENLKKLVVDKINLLQDDFDVSYNEEMIHDLDVSTKDKMETILDSYFSVDERRHIFLRYFSKLTSEFNVVENEMYMTIQKFTSNINPLASLFGRRDEDEIKLDATGHFLKRQQHSGVRVISEKNIYGSEVMMNDNTYFTIIAHHSQSKLRFRKQKIKSLYKTCIFLKKKLSSERFTLDKKGRVMMFTEGIDTFNNYNSDVKSGISIGEGTIFMKNEFSSKTAEVAENDKDTLSVKLKVIKNEIKNISNIKIPNEESILGY